MVRKRIASISANMKSPLDVTDPWKTVRDESFKEEPDLSEATDKIQGLGDHTDSDGNNIWHVCAMSLPHARYQESVLTEVGTSPFEKNAKGKTAFDVALDVGNISFFEKMTSLVAKRTFGTSNGLEKLGKTGLAKKFLSHENIPSKKKTRLINLFLSNGIVPSGTPKILDAFIDNMGKRGHLYRMPDEGFSDFVCGAIRLGSSATKLFGVGDSGIFGNRKSEPFSAAISQIQAAILTERTKKEQTSTAKKNGERKRSSSV